MGLVDHARAPCPHSDPMIGIADTGQAETDLTTGTLRCPSCADRCSRGHAESGLALVGHLERRARGEGQLPTDCMKANTSPHLAEQATGGRKFASGTLAGVLNSEVPFGQPLDQLASYS